MSTYRYLLITAVIILITGCSDKDIISNNDYRATVEAVFSERQQIASNRKEELFKVFRNELSDQQTEALKFLFAFMPLNDLADYSGEFFLANADVALQSRKETPWGKTIPEEIFLHYVLPCRVNNENLDSFRIVYHGVISDRIRGLDIEQAALEINHWCHEKVAYQPADIRTSAPISTMLSARGRCGEESTFTVAALRTAGIPARQVYTPRWAHTDDNHAWVEIWINGKWYYMGACEPEPILDRGWFTEPARRAMLIHTKSFGAYYGNENVINLNKYFSEINNLSKYAIIKKIFVKVIDRYERPIKDASVEYQLYNYAEFYPLATVPTNDLGISSFETGLGDLLIWARKGDDFNYKKISVDDSDTLVLKLDREARGKSSEDLDLIVPVVRTPVEGPSPEQIENNSKRLNEENLMRQAYIEKWMKPDEAEAFAHRINSDTAVIKELIAKSMGNFKTITSFLLKTPEQERELAISLLGVIAEKDLRDTREGILTDHLRNVIKPSNLNDKKDLFVQYVLNPRVANEMLIAWRGYLIESLPSALVPDAVKDPALIVTYINENIKISGDGNYYNTPLSPKGVHDLKVADSKSRSIYFVAICRSLGIPSRFEPGSNIPQYFFNSSWNDVYFAEEKKPSLKKGYLKLSSSSETNPVPEYHIHFTIARFENGRYNTLDYDFNRRITDFKEELQLTPGHYMIVTGNRLDDSKILSNISFFDLSENQHLTIDVKLRKDSSAPVILGTVDMNKVMNIYNQSRFSSDKISEKGVVIAWIEPDKEPTKHILNDLPLLKTELDSWGGYFIFLSDSDASEDLFKSEELKGLPLNSIFGHYNKMDLLRDLMGPNTPSDISFPFIILADKNGYIRFKSSGYSIGIGEQILKNVK